MTLNYKNCFLVSFFLLGLNYELHPKSWTQDWRCSFFMSKLTRENKIEIYERRKKGHRQLFTEVKVTSIIA